MQSPDSAIASTAAGLFSLDLVLGRQMCVVGHVEFPRTALQEVLRFVRSAAEPGLQCSSGLLMLLRIVRPLRRSDAQVRRFEN